MCVYLYTHRWFGHNAAASSAPAMQKKVAGANKRARRLGREARRWRSCAVVGSSGSLAHTSFGAEIDQHDLVLRFNDAPTVGYEANVGNKTTYRLINSATMKDILYRCVAEHGTPNELKDIQSEAQRFSVCKSSAAILKRVKRRLSCCPHDALLLNGQMSYCFQTICPNSVPIARFLSKSLTTELQERGGNSTRISSGIMGLAVARTLCTHARVDVYGFNTRKARDIPNVSYHYYDGCVADDTPQLWYAWADPSPERQMVQVSHLLRGFADVRVREPDVSTSDRVLARTFATDICPDGRRRICGRECARYHHKIVQRSVAVIAAQLAAESLRDFLGRAQQLLG